MDKRIIINALNNLHPWEYDEFFLEISDPLTNNWKIGKKYGISAFIIGWLRENIGELYFLLKIDKQSELEYIDHSLTERTTK